MKNLFLILCVIGLLSFSSCCSSGEDDTVVDRGALPNESINVFPYALNQVFYLKNLNGKPIKFTVTKLAKEAKQEVYEHNVKSCKRKETTNYELLSSEITSDSNYLDLKYFCSNEIGQVANSLVINYTGFTVPVNINVNSPKEYAYDYLTTFSPDNIVTYKNVFQLYTSLDNTQQDKPKFVYYNFENGIIQIVTTKGNKYSL